MINEKLILGHLLMQPELIKEIDLTKDFFKKQQQRLIYNEIEIGNTDLAFLAEKLSGKVEASYIASLLDDVIKTNGNNIQKYIN